MKSSSRIFKFTHLRKRQNETCMAVRWYGWNDSGSRYCFLLLRFFFSIFVTDAKKSRWVGYFFSVQMTLRGTKINM